MDKLLIVINVAGGIGLFLLGMIVLTYGLRALAGHTMRAALMRFTESPLTGAITGAVSTAILQSSSATTVAAVGFEGAELITYPEAIGIIFGANIGTTFKGWIIAILGFKLSLGNIFCPSSSWTRYSAFSPKGVSRRSAILSRTSASYS